MKYIIGVVIAAAAVLGFFVFRHHPVLTTSSPIPTPSSSAQADYQLMVITDAVTLNGKAVHGTVTVKAGDQVATSTTGRARLSWPNGTITTVESDSQVTIKDLGQNGAQSRIELIVGDIWSKVTAVLGGGQYYEVQTQDTVAAVRGTIFRTTYRNHKSRIEGIQHVVRVSLRRADGTTDDSTATDVGEQMAVDSGMHLKARRLTDMELHDKIFERILLETNPSPTPSTTVSSSPRPTTSPSPSVTATATPSPTPSSSSTPSPTPSPTPTATATPTPTPDAPVTLDHAFPSSINAGDTFSLEGSNFLTGRSVSRVRSVSVGGQSASFSVVGATSVFVTPGQLSAGTYDIGLVTTDGTMLMLSNAITIK